MKYDKLKWNKKKAFYWFCMTGHKTRNRRMWGRKVDLTPGFGGIRTTQWGGITGARTGSITVAEKKEGEKVSMPPIFPLVSSFISWDSIIGWFHPYSDWFFSPT